MKKRVTIVSVLVIAITILLSFAVSAQGETAADISGSTTYSGTGYSDFGFLKDGALKTFQNSDGNASITLDNPNGIGSLYLIFDLEYGEYTVKNNDSGATVTAGQHRFLHDYLNLTDLFGTSPKSVTLEFGNGRVRLSEIKAYSEGSAPADVQNWNAPLDGKADIVLFTTHGDDDQLFFAGLFPLYAGERGLGVQAVYLTDHRNLTNERTHEILNGLWATGVRAYPVMGSFADFRIDDLQGTYQKYAELGTSKEELQRFVVEQIRRFKPQVAVCHDFEGEYGHGMHMMYTDLVVWALDVANDATVFPDSAEKYGTWEIPKTYIHLYGENAITIDYDVPLSAFDGMTAFQVSQKLGYPCHESQQYTWFTKWINGKNNEITKASQIDTNSPCKFGLYRTTVGPDAGANDFMENIVSYAEQERIAEEERQRQEQERLEQERLEEERRRQEEAEKQKIEQEAAKKEETKKVVISGAVFVVLGVLVLALLLVVIRMINIHNHNKRRQRNRRR